MNYIKESKDFVCNLVWFIFNVIKCIYYIKADIGLIKIDGNNSIDSILFIYKTIKKLLTKVLPPRRPYVYSRAKVGRGGSSRSKNLCKRVVFP